MTQRPALGSRRLDGKGKDETIRRKVREEKS